MGHFVCPDNLFIDIYLTQIVEQSGGCDRIRPGRFPAFAGFKVHDVILSIDRDIVEGELGPAVDLIKSRSPGEAVDIVVLRDGREKTLSVELGSRPDAKEPSFKVRRRGKLRGLAEPLHSAKPKHTFEVQIDGTIEVRIRKGDSVLVRRFEDEDDLARRSPGLYDKYEDLLDAEDEE